MFAIDLRSDTVTKPSRAMRDAMSNAEVGDDIFGEDPTVNALEARVAELFGVERALYVPSGSMANQIALMVHTRPGDDVIIGQGAHSYFYEAGASGGVAGVQLTLVGSDGLFTADDARAAIKPDDHIHAPTTMIMAENTHNRAGGRVFPLAELRAIRELVDEHGLRFHIDGARILNACAATGLKPSVYGGLADTLSLCFSKGLGAPVGSAIMGNAEYVDRAHRYRKMLGGAMRQCGIIAAGALYALENNVERLADDHRRAREFAEGVAAIDGATVELETVESNIVNFHVTAEGRAAADVVAAAGERGLGAFAIGPRTIRAVFHLHVSDADVARAVAIVGEAIG